jgi:hypothetical protein
MRSPLSGTKIDARSQCQVYNWCTAGIMQGGIDLCFSLLTT